MNRLKKIIKIFLNTVYKCNYHIINSKIKIENIKTIEETIETILKSKSSIGRYGDGEFKYIYYKNSKKKTREFQSYSEKLGERLLEILKSNSDNFLICISPAFKNLDYCEKKSKDYWESTLGKYGEKWSSYLDKNKFYYNANISRFYINSIDKKNVQNRFNLLKKIWKERDILIIEGEKTRLGVGNDLFKEAKSVKRIIAPATNAFSKYEEILNFGKKYGKDKLILIALGPTATILAYDLHNIGYQALDIGHIDIEYEWFLRKTKVRISIKGKYVNEAKEKFIEEFEKDILDKYFSEIIYKI